MAIHQAQIKAGLEQRARQQPVPEQSSDRRRAQNTK